MGSSYAFRCRFSVSPLPPLKDKKVLPNKERGGRGVGGEGDIPCSQSPLTPNPSPPPEIIRHGFPSLRRGRGEDGEKARAVRSPYSMLRYLREWPRYADAKLLPGPA